MSELPKGWVETELGNVTNYGATAKPDLKNIDDECWVLELEDIEKDSSKLLKRLSFADRAPKSSKNSFVKGDVLYGKLRPYLNKMLIATEDGICTTEIVPLKIPNDLFDNRFLFYWLKGKQFSDYVNAVSYGVNMPRLGTKDGKKAPMIVAPQAEQKRIVEKLDEVLAQVDIIKARLDGIPELLKRFRQSVLASAVSGKLTEEWRANKELNTGEFDNILPISQAENEARTSKQKIKGVLELSKSWLPNLPKSWTYKTIDELYKTNHIFEYVDGNHGSLYPRKNDFDGDGVLFVTATQIYNGIIDWSKVPRLQTAKAEVLNKGWAKKGDVILTHNATVGRVAMADDAIETFLLGTSATLYRTEDSRLVRKYLYYYFLSRAWQSQLESVMEQSTRNQVSITKQALMFVALPSLKEQREIVRLVDQYFTFADTIEAQVKKAQARVDNLTQSLLAKAFRGELLAQDPTDEPADKLLERIAEARKEAEALAKAAKKAEAARKKAAKVK